MTILRKTAAVAVGVLVVGMVAFNMDEVETTCGPQLSAPAAFTVGEKVGTLGKVIHNLTEGEAPSTLDVYRTVMGGVGTIEGWFGNFDSNVKTGQDSAWQTGWRVETEKRRAAALASCCAPPVDFPNPDPTSPPPEQWDPKNASISGAVGGRPALPDGPDLAAAALRAAAPSDSRWLAQIPLGVAIAKEESSFVATNANNVLGGHVGYWQISGPNADTLKLGDRTDPYVNARYAYALWKGRGGTWAEDWTTYDAALKEASQYARFGKAAPGRADQATAADAIRALGKADGASPITPHKDPQGLPAFDLISTGAVRDKIAETIRTNPTAYGARYVITNMQIASPKSSWAWRPYTPITTAGDFRHTGHVHVSYTDGPVTSSTAPTAPTPTPAKPTFCPSSGGTLGAPTSMRVLGNFGSDHSARVLTMADGTRLGTWNSYFGDISPGQSGPRGADRIRKAMAVIGPQVDILGGQEFSEESHRTAALEGLGPDFYAVADDTSQPIWIRKTLTLTGQSSEHVFHRTDDYEGPKQGERWVNDADVTLPSGSSLRFVNLHQLPVIQDNGVLDTSMPKRIGWAKTLWRKALDRVTDGQAKGAAVLVGDMNYAGDPDGMFAAAGLTSASSIFGNLKQATRTRDIDQILFAGPAVPPAASGGGGDVPADFDQQGNPRTVEQAIAWMSEAIPNGGHGYSVEGHCEGWMTRAYGHGGGYPSATAHWDAPGPRHVGATADVPRGALIFYRTSNPDGHVALSLGGGQVMSTDFNGRGWASGKIGTGPSTAMFGQMLGWRAPNFRAGSES